MKFAALDLGSNSFLCLIGTLSPLGEIKVEKDMMSLVRLGEGLSQNKNFSPDALSRASDCLAKFKSEIINANCDTILAMATAAARDAENKKDFEIICENLNIPLEIITGEDEARLTFLGAQCFVAGLDKIPAKKDLPTIVIDIGGRSTEIIFGRGEKIELRQSLPLGCVSWTEKFASQKPLSQSQRDQFLAEIQQVIQEPMLKIQKILNGQKAIIKTVAGTPTALAMMQVEKSQQLFRAEEIEGMILRENKLADFADQLSLLTTEEIIRDFSIEPKRADVIYVGTEILLSLLRAMKVDEACVSTKGLRYGVALELHHRKLEGSLSHD